MVPPRVRLAVLPDPSQLRVSQVSVDCEFDTAAPPMTLVKFCNAGACQPADPANELEVMLSEASALSLEELNYLLDRDGY